MPRLLHTARSERGEISLTGLLVAMTIFGVVLTATLTSFDVFNRNSRDNQVRNEATDRARQSSDQMARQMRNLATPTMLQPNAVALASAYDMVFETVAPYGTPTTANSQNIEFVRYCLDTTTRRFWTMEMPPSTITASTVAPSTAGTCPGSGWSNQKVVATDVTNRYGGLDRPIFTFDSAVNNEIHRIRVDLYVDPDPGVGPKEQQVTTGVDLRNQDRAPVASWTWTSTTTGVAVLNASASTDPDNDPLSYCWYDTVASGQVGTCGAGSVGDTATLRYRTTSGNHNITLKVLDPSGLSNSLTKTVTVK